jgi:hypothetical protein
MWDVIRDIIWRSPWWLQTEFERSIADGSAVEKEKAASGIEKLKAGKFSEAQALLNEIFDSRKTASGAANLGVNVKRL